MGGKRDVVRLWVQYYDIRNVVGCEMLCVVCGRCELKVVVRRVVVMAEVQR